MSKKNNHINHFCCICKITSNIVDLLKLEPIAFVHNYVKENVELTVHK